MRNKGGSVSRLRRLIGVLVTLSCVALAQQSNSATDHGSPQPTSASSKAASAAISISPAVVVTRGSLGQSLTQTLSIHNETSMPFSFEMVAQDVLVRDGKRVFVPAGETPGSIAASAVFSQKIVQVAPGQSASVDVTLTLPLETSLRAMVAIFRGVDKVPAQGGAVMMTASLGCLITFTTSDNFAVQVGELDVTPQTAARPLSAAAVLTNSGAEPIIPEGVLAILSSQGSLLGKAAFPPLRLLPGERLPFTTEFLNELAPGRYRALATFQFEGKTVTDSSNFVVP